MFTTRAAMFATGATVFTAKVALLATVTTFAAFTTLLATITAVTTFATVFITTAVLVVTIFVVLVFVLVVVAAFCVRSNRHGNTQSSKQEKSFFHCKILSFNMFGTALGSACQK